jgi:sugar/nucleoside kinase (ribokinase family)
MAGRDTFDVIAAGHLCLDMIPLFQSGKATGSLSELLHPGALVHMGGMTLCTGGAVSNVGRAMKIFGCTVGFMAKVGGDAIGRITVEILEQSGSIEGISISPGEASSYTIVLSPPGVDRIFFHCPGVNDTFGTANIDMQAVRKARLFHLGYPPLMRSLFVDDGEQLAGILKEVKKSGLTTSLDIALPDPESPAGKADWRKIYERCLPYVDLFLPSLEEIFFTLHPQTYLARKEQHRGQELVDFVTPAEVGSLAEEILSMGCRIAVLKAGHNGLYLKTASRDSIARIGKAAPRKVENWAERELWCPAFPADEIASAVGAGDSAIAAFLTGLLRGHTVEECLALANCAGYLNLTAVDTLSGLPSWETLIEIRQTLRPRDNTFLIGDWSRNERSGIWEKNA